MMLFYLPLIIAGGLWEAMLTPPQVAQAAKVVAETPKAMNKAKTLIA